MNRRDRSRLYEGLWKWACRLGGLSIMLGQAASPSPADKPFLYVAALAMMGITITIPADLKRWRERDGGDRE